MSSLDRRSFIRLGMTAGLSLGLAACFRPLYGPTASGKDLASLLASIEVEKIQTAVDYEETVHELRSELIYLLNGSGGSTAKTYRLRLSFEQTSQTPVIDRETGRAQISTITGTAGYTLYDKTDKIVAQGDVQTMVTYERPEQRFASIRSLREARLRMARELANHVKTRLAATLSAR